MSEIKLGESKTERSKESQLIIQLAGGAIFGGLSIVVAIVLSPIINASRIQGWGIALFDPTSWVWIIAFLIFGALSGIVSCVTGSFGLLIIDPTGVGPAFKFLATIPHIIIPYLVLRLREKGVINSQKLKAKRFFIFSGILSLLVRIIAMIGLNLLFVATLWADFYMYINLEIIGLGGITGLSAILIFTPIINLYTGALDLAVPYGLVFVPKLDEKVGFW